MRDEKNLLSRIEDEAMTAAAQTDIEILERKMLDGGGQEKLALARAILAAQDITYEPVRAVGLLEDLVRTSGDRAAVREAVEMLGGRYDGTEPVETAEYTELLDEIKRSEKKYRKQNPGRLTFVRAGAMTIFCAVIALLGWFWLPGMMDQVKFLQLAVLGAVAALIVLVASRRLIVAGLSFAAVTGCLTAVRYSEVAQQVPHAITLLFGVLGAAWLLQLLLALRRSRQTVKQEKARENCKKAYELAIRYAEAGVAAAESLTDGERTAALRAYAKHWSEESRRLNRACRKLEKKKTKEPPEKEA